MRLGSSGKSPCSCTSTQIESHSCFACEPRLTLAQQLRSHWLRVTNRGTQSNHGMAIKRVEGGQCSEECTWQSAGQEGAIKQLILDLSRAGKTGRG